MTLSGAFDIGDTYPASLLITDSTGVAANAGAVTLTFTLPDQTTLALSGGSITNTPTGTYYYDFAITQSGKHNVLWQATGTNAGSYEDTFYVEPRPTRGIVGLQDIKTFLGNTGTATDEQLRFFIHAASTAVESYCNRKFTYRTQTVTLSGGDVLDRLDLPVNPVGSIVSVVENGTTLAASDYVLDGPGPVLYKRSGTNYSRWWLPGTDNIVVTYSTGSASIPADVRLAVRFMVRELWDDSQRGNQTGNVRSADQYDTGNTLNLFTPVIRSLLANYLVPGFA